MIDAAELATIVARSNAATGETWRPQRDVIGNPVVEIEFRDGHTEFLRVSRDKAPADSADVEFIGHARQDVDRLVAGLSGMVELTQEELEDIDRRWRLASPGPWIAALESEGGVGGCNVITVSLDDNEPDLYLWRGDDWSSWNLGDVASDADFDFVASARQDIPKLLDALRRAAV